MKLSQPATMPSSSQPLSVALLLSGLVHAALLAGLVKLMLSQAPALPLPALHLQLLPASQPGAQQAAQRPSRTDRPAQQPAASKPTSPQPAQPAPSATALQPAAPSHGTPAAEPAAGAATAVATSNANPLSNSGDSKPAHTGSSDRQPAVYRSATLHNPEAPYPERSRELGEQGRVQLKVRVSAQGKALQVDIVGSSNSRRLDEAARQAVAEWRFLPARQDGVAIESSLLVPISFVLSP